MFKKKCSIFGNWSVFPDITVVFTTVFFLQVILKYFTVYYNILYSKY